MQSTGRVGRGAKRWTPAKLKKCGQLWQGLLRLAEWKINYEFMGLKELQENVGGYVGYTTAGASTWDAGKKEAWVWIADPAEIEREGLVKSDIEGTILHELLHIKLQGHEFQPKDEDINIERAVLDLEALLSAVVPKKLRSF